LLFSPAYSTSQIETELWLFLVIRAWVIGERRQSDAEKPDRQLERVDRGQQRICGFQDI
jgi:hypothetical protein